MRSLVRIAADLGVAGTRRPGVLVLLFPLLGLSGTAHSDAYLDMIQAEAEKVEGDSEGGVESAEEESAPSDALSRFEAELEKKYRGSYLFYMKLPMRSREEVLLEYEQGATIEQVRGTILERYLHGRM